MRIIKIQPALSITPQGMTLVHLVSIMEVQAPDPLRDLYIATIAKIHAILSGQIRPEDLCHDSNCLSCLAAPIIAGRIKNPPFPEYKPETAANVLIHLMAGFSTTQIWETYRGADIATQRTAAATIQAWLAPRFATQPPTEKPSPRPTRTIKTKVIKTAAPKKNKKAPKKKEANKNKKK